MFTEEEKQRIIYLNSHHYSYKEIRKKKFYIDNKIKIQSELNSDIKITQLELLDKTIGQLGPLNDLVGIDRIKQMIAYDQLEVVPMSYIRGRSFSDSIVIVYEAQNLTEDHIKLLIARCGEGTRIFFDGDFKQADSQLFKNKNGLKLLLRLSESEKFAKIFATVTLQTVERSLVAQAADYLDEIS